MLIDLLVIIFIVSAIFRGREVGFVQQFFATAGFFIGLVVGALVQPKTISLVQGEVSRAVITLVTTLGMAFLFLVIGEITGNIVKTKLRLGRFNKLDNGLGAVLSVVTVLIAVWLSAAVIKTLPFPGLQQEARESRIASALSTHLPYAPSVIADIGRLIDPNGFPQVFTGLEPSPPAQINLPSSSQLRNAVNKDRASVVKVIGQGCGGVVDGSGFVVGDDMVATNAHVVAGIQRQYVQDSNGNHTATVVWFDPKLDIAILRVQNLAGPPLPLHREAVGKKTPAAILGFPGGGGFIANPAAVLDQFTARGRDIYGRNHTERSIYELGGDVKQGNSGGPLVLADGSVIGIIFARSTSYENVGYALTVDQLSSAIAQANARNATVGTGTCTD